MDCDEIDLSTRDTEASSKEEGENSQRNDEVDAQSMGIMR